MPKYKVTYEELQEPICQCGHVYTAHANFGDCDYCNCSSFNQATKIKPTTKMGYNAQQELERCKEKLSEAVEKLQEQQAFIEQVMEAPKQFALVVATYQEEGNGRARVLTGSMLQDVACNISAIAGDWVRVINGKGIVDVVEGLNLQGHITTIDHVISSTQVEVKLGATSVVILTTIPVVKGDRVQLDPSSSCVLQKLPAPPSPTSMPEVERVEWASIGGHKLAKAEIEQAVLWPMLHGNLIAAYGQRPTKGILFSGPPGCGKTMLAKATATAIAAHANPGFFSVRGPELMNAYVGETERNIRELFKSAREHQTVHKTRAVIFIDEADSCLGTRGFSLHNDISVPAFLVEMDGIDAALSPLIILATNRPELLDPAIVREGRIDRRIKIERPEREDVEQLFGLYLRKRPHDKAAAIEVNATSLLQTIPVLWKSRSGALVASLVDRMTAKALNRDISTKCKSPTGITLDDAVTAITEAANQHSFT